jgi:hypothetical protein
MSSVLVAWANVVQWLDGAGAQWTQKRCHPARSRRTQPIQ